MMGDWGGWGMGFGWIFVILFWALVILKERYARGEIGREQYEQMRRDLES
jgi:putative membrane protein